MWFKFDTQLFKRHWQAKAPLVRQRLCFLAILSWEEQGIPKDFEYLSWATGLSVEMLEAVWPEFEAVAEQRNGKWMMREMWAGIDSFAEKSERAKNAVEKRWNNERNATSDTKCITTGNTNGNTDKIRLDKIREATVNKGASNAHARENDFRPPFAGIPATAESEQLEKQIGVALKWLIDHYRMPVTSNQSLYESAALTVAQCVAEGFEERALKDFFGQARAPVKLRFFAEDFSAWMADRKQTKRAA